ncbi:MAG TPA: sodium pump decarboxylase subunit gamma [Acetivibrio sp.]|nr:sodium pump decarboxylase subunit gamma [Acetivibrio sp.]
MKDQLNEEIILAISAALAAYETRPDYKLVVKSFKRISQTSPVWSTTGRLEGIGRSI